MPLATERCAFAANGFCDCPKPPVESELVLACMTAMAQCPPTEQRIRAQLLSR
jgi:hypothetical protein